jgi:hypothetical protein
MPEIFIWVDSFYMNVLFCPYNKITIGSFGTEKLTLHLHVTKMYIILHLIQPDNNKHGRALVLVHRHHYKTGKSFSV